MKIGIITHHYVGNFGAVLQAYALINTLQNQHPNAVVEIVDYRINQHDFRSNSRFFHFKIKKDTIASFIDKLRLFKYFRSFQTKMPHSRRVHNANDILHLGYDYLVIGSDEVWNFYDKQSFSQIKFGVGLSNQIKTLSYAASAGASTDISLLPEECQIALKSFQGIAVRDSVTSTLIKNLGLPCSTVLDPTLIYDFEGKVRPYIQEILKEKYVLIYDCRLDDLQLSEIKEFAQKKNMLLLGAGEYSKQFDYRTTAITPFEWTQLFKNAKFVVTGTFHGTAFSIKYERSFVTYVTEINRVEKVSSLLYGTGLEERIITESSRDRLIDVLESVIDYKRCSSLFYKRKSDSLKYLLCQIYE